MIIRAARHLPPLVVDAGSGFALRSSVVDETGTMHMVEWPLPPRRLLNLTRDMMAASEVALIRGIAALPEDPQTDVGDPSS